jgi:hypothetical protein
MMPAAVEITQRRDLRHQPLSNGEDRVRARGGRRIHPALQDADHQPAHDVYSQHHDPGDGVPLDERHGAVHRTEELRFARRRRPPPARLIVIDVASAQLGVDRHLLARHGVEREAGRHLRHAFEPFEITMNWFIVQTSPCRDAAVSPQILPRSLQRQRGCGRDDRMARHSARSSASQRTG